VYRPVCDAGWCRAYPPFIGSVRGFFESADGGRLLAADEGVFRQTDGGWTLVLADPDVATIVARSLDDVWVFGRALSRFNRGTWITSTLPGVPVSAVQSQGDVVLLTRDGGVFRAAVPGAWSSLNTGPRVGPTTLIASQTSTFIVDSVNGSFVRLFTRNGSQWGRLEFSLGPFGSVFQKAVANQSTVVFSSSDTAFVYRGGTLLDGPALPVVGRSGSQVLTVNQRGELLDVSETGFAVVATLSSEARALVLKADGGGLAAPFRTHDGTSGLWFSQLNQLWRLERTGEVARFGSAFSDSVLAGLDGTDSTTILAGRTVFDLSGGDVTRRDDLTRSVRALRAAGGVAVAIANDGVFQRSGAGWQVVYLRSGLTAVGTNGDTVAATGPSALSFRRDGGWSTVPLIGSGGSVAVSSAGDIFVGSDSSVFVLDGGVVQPIFVATARVLDLASNAQGTFALLSSGLLCDVVLTTCDVVGTGPQARIWSLGSRGLGLTNGTAGWIEISLTGQRTLVSAPFIPSALWVTEDGGVAAGAIGAVMFQGE